MSADDLIKVVALILSLISILIAVMLFLTITLPSKIEAQIKDRVELASNKQNELFAVRVSAMDSMMDICIRDLESTGSSDLKARVYAIKHFLRLLQGGDSEKILSLRAFQGLGRDIAYLLPQLEVLHRNQEWGDDVAIEYRKLIEKIRS